MEWPKGVVPLIGAAGSWVFDGTMTLQPVAHGLEDAVELLTNGTTVTGGAFPERLAAWRFHFETAGIEVNRAKPRVQLTVEGSLNHLDAELVFVYGTKEMPASSDRAAVWEEADHLVLADVSPDELASLAGKANHVHISDCDGKKHGDLPPGPGVVPFEPYLR